VAPLVEAVATVPLAEPGAVLDAVRALLAEDPGRDVVVVVDDRGCPVHLVRAGLRDGDRDDDLRAIPLSLRVRPSASLVEVVTRAMTRLAARRFDPVLCVDDTGRLLGLVRPERMTLRLAELHSGAPPVDVPDQPSLSPVPSGEPYPSGGTW
jgi:hypothetical protein